MSSTNVRVGADLAKQLKGEADRLGVDYTYAADAAVTELMKLPETDRERLIRDAAKRRRNRETVSAA